MADVQPDKFIKINPNVMEALAKIRIPGEARQVLDFIIRKTWGWHKKEDRIPLSQFVLGTNLKKPNILRALSKLITMNLIIIKKDNANGHKYIFNKDFEMWKPLSKKITSGKALSKKITSVIKKDNKSLSKKIPSKDTTKDIYSKDRERGKKFIPPTLEEVKKYITEKGYSISPQRFYDYFQEANWIDSKGNKVRNWKQKIITWQSYEEKKKQSKIDGKPEKIYEDDYEKAKAGIK